MASLRAKFVSVAQLVELLGVSRATGYRWAQGFLHGVRSPTGKILVPITEVESFFKISISPAPEMKTLEK